MRYGSKVHFIGIIASNQCWFSANNPKDVVKRKRWFKRAEDGWGLKAWGWTYEGPLGATRFDNVEDAIAVCDRLQKGGLLVDWSVVEYTEKYSVQMKDLYCAKAKEESDVRR